MDKLDKKFKLINSEGKEYLSDIPGTLGGNKKLKIYGKLDCPSAARWIEKGYYTSNRVFFENEDVAIAAGYRPCAVCMPEEYAKWKKNNLIKLGGNMEINKLKILLEKSWNRDTCSPGLRYKWSEDNPSLGQCAITSLIVNDYFGGKIMRCMASTGSHYYNLIDNEIIDLTAEQFGDEVPKYEDGEERTIEYLLSNEDTKNRYLMLYNNLKEVINEEKTRENRYNMCIKLRKETFNGEKKKVLKRKK